LAPGREDLDSPNGIDERVKIMVRDFVENL
jgi:hypothetical protein